MAINLYRVIQPVQDIEVAQRFYAAVLETDGERVSPGRHYFDCGGTILACYDPDADGDGSEHTWKPHGNQYLYFAVSDLEAVFARVREAGGIIDSEIETMPWGERLFYCKDPSLNPISFVDEATVFTGKSSGLKHAEALDAFEKLMMKKALIMKDMTLALSQAGGPQGMVSVLEEFGMRLSDFIKTAEMPFHDQFHDVVKSSEPAVATIFQRHESDANAFIAALIELKHGPRYAKDQLVIEAIARFESITHRIPQSQ